MSPLCQEGAAAVTQCSEELQEGAVVVLSVVGGYTRTQATLTSTSVLPDLQRTANVSGGLLQQR